MKILIVDDSYLLCERVRDALLQIDGIEISGIANNGIDALQMIKCKNPDFVIMDIRMPRKNGIEVLQQMKEMGNKSKVCIFTNFPYKQYKQKCMEAGSSFFYSKNEDFNAMIDMLLKQTKKQKTKNPTG